jgi:hypothetical protein
VTSVPDITRLIARIETWKEGKALGRAEAARRLDEAHKLVRRDRAHADRHAVRVCWAPADSGDVADRDA